MAFIFFFESFDSRQMVANRWYRRQRTRQHQQHPRRRTSSRIASVPEPPSISIAIGRSRAAVAARSPHAARARWTHTTPVTTRRAADEQKNPTANADENLSAHAAFFAAATDPHRSDRSARRERVGAPPTSLFSVVTATCGARRRHGRPRSRPSPWLSGTADASSHTGTGAWRPGSTRDVTNGHRPHEVVALIHGTWASPRFI